MDENISYEIRVAPGAREVIRKRPTGRYANWKTA